MKNFNRDIMAWPRFPEYDLIWTDPPWEENMVKWFYTKMRKDGYTPPSHSHAEIFNHFARVARTNKPIVMEYGMKGWETVVSIMESHGHKLVGNYRFKQSMDRYFVILVFNERIDIAPAKGFQIITDTLAGINITDGTVFDPFAGLGLTARAVRLAGWNYIGSELNPKRFAELIKINT